MNKVPNKDIRVALIGYKNYQVAEVLGVTEFTFCRWLRKELSSERREQIIAAIEKLSKGAINELSR